MAAKLIQSAIVKRSCKYTDGYFCYSIPQAAIAGLAIAGAAIFLGLLFLTFICVRRRRRRNKIKNGQQVDSLRYLGSELPEPIAFNPNAY